MMRGCLRGDPATETVAGKNDVFGVDAEPGGVGGSLNVGENSVGVFEIVGEGVLAGASPGAAVVEGDGVSAGAADSLREIEVLFIAGKAVA